MQAPMLLLMMTVGDRMMVAMVVLAMMGMLAAMLLALVVSMGMRVMDGDGNGNGDVDGDGCCCAWHHTTPAMMGWRLRTQIVMYVRLCVSVRMRV